MATVPKCLLFFLLFVLFTYAQIHETIIMTDTLHASKNSPVHVNDGPRIGRPAPDFEADAAFKGEFVKLRLSSYRGKYVVLLFYPLDFTFVCPTELIAFSDRYDEFKELNTEVIGISVDSKFTHLAWINTPRKEGGVGRLNIPLVSDMTKRISRDYRVLVEEGQDAGVALRGLFIINEHGIVRQITVNDLPVGRSVDETIRLVKAFQYTDIHGEVCPANWTPGARTVMNTRQITRGNLMLLMVPDPQKSKDYFHKVHDNSAHC